MPQDSQPGDLHGSLIIRKHLVLSCRLTDNAVYRLNGMGAMTRRISPHSRTGRGRQSVPSSAPTPRLFSNTAIIPAGTTQDSTGLPAIDRFYRFKKTTKTIKIVARFHGGHPLAVKNDNLLVKDSAPTSSFLDKSGFETTVTISKNINGDEPLFCLYLFTVSAVADPFSCHSFRCTTFDSTDSGINDAIQEGVNSSI